MAKVLTTKEARQGARPQGVIWVLVVSMILAVIAGLGLTLGWISLPW